MTKPLPPGAPRRAKTYLLKDPMVVEDLKKLSIKEFASRYGLTITTATAWRHRVLDIPSNRHPQQVIDRILQLQSWGEPAPMIAFDVGLPVDKVYHILRRFGLKADPEWVKVRVTISKRPALLALHEEIMRVEE